MVAVQRFAALLLVGCSQWATAQIPVAGFPIPGHIESPTKGHFVELTLAIAKEANLDIDIQITPPPRAIESFMQGKSTVLFPALDVFFSPEQPIVRTKGSFNCKEDFVFTKKGRPAYHTLDELKGKRVGLTQGYPYVKAVVARKDIGFEMALSDEANVEKLMKGRIEAFVVEKASGTRAFQEVNAFGDMQVDYKKPVSRQDVYWAFHNTDEGRALAQKFDRALFKLYKQPDFYQHFKVGVIEPMGCKP